ncbi:MAG: 2-hydroxyacid dehydrogenase [Actinobacteria bacterium]|nr:MAG: 2-hydroxyacid dehydrogenase [Actinomycetota bacterium]
MTRFAVFDTKPYDRQTIGPLAEQAGVDIAFHEFRLDEETVPLVRDVDGVCVFVNDHLTADVIAALADSGVRLISLRCAGFNNVDLAAAQANGIRVVRVPAYSPYAVAEHAVALLMALNRKVAKAHNRVHELNFSLHGLVGFDIHGKTIGIIGTGKIGKVAAQILSGFGTTVLLYDPFPDERWAKKNGFTYLSLKELAERSDIISLHTPLTPETLHLVGPQFLRTVKRGVYIINVSRGALVDTKALIKALKKGRVAGVALDVYEEEEGVFFEDHSGHILQDDTLARLLTFPNVVITAHQAFLTEEALNEIAEVTVENMRRFAAGQKPLAGTVLEA